MPKISVELLSFSALVFGVVLGLVLSGSVQNVISIATLFLFALLKISPSLIRVISSLNQLNHNLSALQGIPTAAVIQSEITGTAQIDFTQSLELRNIAFVYPDSTVVFKQINFTFLKGEKVGIVGASGVGKSTLQDILIGLLTPGVGAIYLDGKKLTADNLVSWRRKIGYVPQEIFLYSGSVVDNVVLNREYNESRLLEVLKQAHIYDFLLTKQGIHTKVGANGVMLSGGQKQRIGIARALYGAPDLLVLDEATSALDTETEANIMHEIYSENSFRTLLIITHRTSTLSGCNKIFRLENQALTQVV